MTDKTNLIYNKANSWGEGNIIARTFEFWKNQIYNWTIIPNRLHFQFQNWQPRHSFSFSRGNYLVKVAETPAELNELFRLRYEVFHKEYRNARIPFGWDSDQHDLYADHLYIRHLTQMKIVGTYRLIQSERISDFYSSSEFLIDSISALEGTKLELSRACIHRDYRTGNVMNLLWRGISRYVKASQADYLFGCSSIKTEDVEIANQVACYLNSNQHVLSKLHIIPKDSFRMPGFDPQVELNTSESERISKELIPPLLQSYLKMGAKVGIEPAYDRDFKCIDFFTLLSFHELSQAYERRYVSEE